MTAHNESYLKRLVNFYFAPKMRSFFTVLYLIFFGYFSIFYIDNFVLALKFILNTFTKSTMLLDLGYLFWGALFIITLIIPLSVSIYAICLPYEIYKKDTERSKKVLLTILIILATLDLIIAMDESVRYIIDRPELSQFVIKYNL